MSAYALLFILFIIGVGLIMLSWYVVIKIIEWLFFGG